MVNGEVVGEVDQFTYLGVHQRRWRTRDSSPDFKSKPSLCLTLRHSEIQEHQPEDKDQILQKHCLKHSTICRRILEDDQNHPPQARSLPEQVPAQDSPYWAQTISNYELRRQTGSEPITQQVQGKRWKWIGHVLHMPPAALP